MLWTLWETPSPILALSSSKSKDHSTVSSGNGEPKTISASSFWGLRMDYLQTSVFVLADVEIMRRARVSTIEDNRYERRTKSGQGEANYLNVLFSSGIKYDRSVANF